MTEAEGIAGARILSIIERIEQLEEEIKSLNEGKKEVFSEAKGEGYDIKVLREILKIRKLDRDERDEQESLIDLYMRAISEAAPEKQAAWGAGTRGRVRRRVLSMLEPYPWSRATTLETFRAV